jgi:hypothetical protein
MLEKTQAREEMEQSPTVYSFIKGNLLLNPDFHRVFTSIHKKSEEIEELIGSFRGDFAFLKHIVPAPSRAVDSDKYLQISVINKLRRNIKSKKEEDEFNRELLDLKSADDKKRIIQIKRRSSEIQNVLSKFEQAQRQSLEILTSITLFICRQCHNVVSTNRFINTTCLCGIKVKRTSDIRKEAIAFFDSRLRNFIANKYWFEHGVDYLLRKKNFQTLCGVYVLGHSGCMHEIDNIAESKTSNFRIFGECKTTDIRTNDVFILAGKMADIGCSRAYIFTTTKEVQKEIVHLARSRNISTVTDVLHRPIQDLLREIRED